MSAGNVRCSDDKVRELDEQLRDCRLTYGKNFGTSMKPRTRVVHVGLAEALTKGPPPPGNLAVPVFSRGSLEVELYTPVGHDPQKPHARDEVYFVSRGSGRFFDGERYQQVEAGSFVRPCWAGSSLRGLHIGFCRLGRFLRPGGRGVGRLRSPTGAGPALSPGERAVSPPVRRGANALRR